MNRIEQRKNYADAIEQIGRDTKKVCGEAPLVDLIESAMIDLVNMECPHCHEYLDLPSLEDIQEWLKEEK